jgi:hypothetical protein
MKRSHWLAALAGSFLAASVIIYYIHFLIFRDSTFIFKYFVAQMGFLPISTALVTIVLNQLMGKRDKNIRLQKLNMVIGAFYSDVGTELLKILATSDHEAGNFGQTLRLNSAWSKSDFNRTKIYMKDIHLDKDILTEQLAELKSFLSCKRNHLLRLLENPNLLEHETFSQLLRAVFHLTEELDGRLSLNQLPQSDYSHLRGDCNRVYILLVNQWLNYMESLHKNYPYLFSLAIRTNPFNPEASIEVID